MTKDEYLYLRGLAKGQERRQMKKIEDALPKPGQTEADFAKVLTGLHRKLEFIRGTVRALDRAADIMRLR